MAPTDVVVEIIGSALVLFTLREVFRDIFHPTRSGSLSDLIGQLASRFLGHTTLRPSVGPLVLVSVIASWVFLLGTGFALIYFGLYPDYFVHPAAENRGLAERIMRSCYLSLGSLDTFQTFDMQPRVSWLNLVIALQGLLGLALITASISWLVLIYPALSRNRFFSKRVSLLIRAQEQSGISILQSKDSILSELAQELTQVRIDIILFPVLLNFYPGDRSVTLALVLPQLVELVRQGESTDLPTTIQFGAAQLDVTLHEFSQTLAERVLSIQEKDRNTILKRFAELDR